MGGADASDPKVAASINAAMEAANDLNMVGCCLWGNFLPACLLQQLSKPLPPKSQNEALHAGCWAFIWMSARKRWQHSIAVQGGTLCGLPANISTLQLMASLMHPHITHALYGQPCTAHDFQCNLWLIGPCHGKRHLWCRQGSVCCYWQNNSQQTWHTMQPFMTVSRRCGCLQGQLIMTLVA